jgi:hypothetical protein
MNGWYVLYNGNPTGPHDEPTIRKGLGEGHLTRVSLLGRSPAGPFRELGSLPEFADVAPAERAREFAEDLGQIKTRPAFKLDWFVVQWGLFLASLVCLAVARAERSSAGLIAGLGLFVAYAVVRVARGMRR